MANKFYTLQFFDEQDNTMGFYSEDGSGLVVFVSDLSSAKMLSYDEAINYAEKLLLHGAMKYKKVFTVDVCEIIATTNKHFTYNRENLKSQIYSRKCADIERQIYLLQEQLQKLSIIYGEENNDPCKSS